MNIKYKIYNKIYNNKILKHYLIITYIIYIILILRFYKRKNIFLFIFMFVRKNFTYFIS